MCLLRGTNEYLSNKIRVTFSAMPQGLLSTLSPGKPGFDPGLFLVRFVIDILALVPVLKSVILFSPVTIILQMLRCRFCLHAALCLKDKLSNPVNLQKAIIFWKSWDFVWRGIFTLKKNLRRMNELRVPLDPQ